MRRIPTELIDEIRHRSDIVETISQYLPLEQKGKNYWGLCPFHEDNNPSMSVSPDQQIFKCFVCNEGGNVFSFIQKHEKINFVEAVIKQAKNLNIDMSQYEMASIQPVNKRNKVLYELMDTVKQFTSYQLNTKEGQPALEVLKQRGYPSEIISKFEIGVALDNNQIYKFLNAKGFSNEEMKAVDIIRINGNKINDVFYNRIMFPIKNEFGQTIAFSARTLDKNNDVKYINTSETEIYTKGNHIYNLDLVRAKERYHDYLIVTEGVTDVFAFTMAEFDNVVSLLGVACTKTQISLLKKSAKEVLLAFDGDKAGYDATYKIGKDLVNANVPVKVWFNDSGKDPDDLFKEQGKDALIKGIENAQTWLDFLLSYGTGLYGTQSFENKKKLISFFMPHLNHQDSLTKDYYLKKLSVLTSIDVDSLKGEIKEPIFNKRRHETIPIEKRQKFIYTNNISRAQLELLNQILVSKEAAEIFRRELGFFPNDKAQDLSLVIQNIYRFKNELNIADLLSEDIDEEIKGFILELQDRFTINRYDKDIVMENIERIKHDLENNIEYDLLAMINNTDDIETQKKILEEYIRQKQKLK